jgi:hypothetical protein
MKKALSILMLLVSGVALSPSAMAFSVVAQAFVTPNVVTGTVCNDIYDAAIACNVTSTGLLNAGFPIYSTVTLVLLPGECENANVYATFPYFFINGAATADCSFD